MSDTPTVPSSQARTTLSWLPRNPAVLGIVFCLLAMTILVNVWRAAAQNSSPVNLGDHGSVQYVDPDGINNFYFREYSGADVVDFAAYRLTGAQFSSLYYTTTNNQKLAVPEDLSVYPQPVTWQVDIGTAERYNDTLATDLPNVAPGIYMITGTTGEYESAASLVVVSRNVLMMKHALNGQVAVWASKLSDGSPSAGMTVTLYDADGNALGQAATDAQGVAKFSTDIVANYANELIAVGELDGDATMTGAEGLWRVWSYSPYYYGYAKEYNAYINTDRPIYRPNDTVSFAAILREFADGSYSPLDPSTPVTAKLKDSRYNDVTTLTLTPDEFGMVTAEYVLGDEPSLGTYQVVLTIGEADEGQNNWRGQFTQAFKVEEYEKPEYSVSVSTSDPYVISGDSFNITVNSDYFFGQPVTNASVNVKVYKQRFYSYYWWGGLFEDIGDVYYPSYGGGRELLDEFNGVTDADGAWSQQYTADLGDTFGAAYSVVATVTDERERPIQGSANVSVHWNTFNLRTRTTKYGFDVNEPVLLNLTATDHDKQPVAGQNINVKVEERVYTDSWYDRYYNTVAEQTVTTNADGTAQASFDQLPQGWYRITSTTTDARGREVAEYTYASVYDRTSRRWYYYNNEQISLLFDQDEYGPGDTARLMIQSRITDTVALVTIEREDVIDEFVVRIDGPLTTLDIPIKEEYKPNAFVKAHIFKPTDPISLDDNRYRVPAEAEMIVGTTELNVPAEDRRLSIDIEADKAEYGPGDEATITFQVNNAAGQPESSRIMVALVDEAIFSLSEDLSADIFDTFHGKRGSEIYMYGSPISPYFSWQSDWSAPAGTATPAPNATSAPNATQPASQPAAPADSEEAASGDDALRTDEGEELNTRRVFEDTAYWNPMVTTDANGVATITVPLPDNLTTWRVIARAVTIDTKVGEQTDDILVTQEVIARPVMPRFSVLGDRFAIGVAAQNYTGQDSTGQATMQADGLMLLDGEPRPVAIPNGGSDVAGWTAIASHVGTKLVTTTVQLNNGGDQLQQPFIVKPFSVPERKFAAGTVTAAKPSATEVFDIPLNAVNEATELELDLSPSIALSLLDNLDSLIGYPYGCVEQTMSRMLPTAAAAKVYEQLGIPNPQAEELPKIVNKGLQKLYGFQQSNGSWGWFYADEPNTYLTAYVLFGLHTIKDAGFEVSDSVIENGLNSLVWNLDSTSNVVTKAYALHVMSLMGRGDLEKSQALLGELESLNPFGKAMLAMALNNEGDTAGANQALNALLTTMTETGTTAYWSEDPYEDWTWWHWRTMASADKNTAAALQAITQIRPEEERLSKVVRWLMNERQSVSRYYRGAGWSNTQATAFAVLGLLDYIQVSSELESNYTYEVKLNGAVVASGEVTPENFTQPVEPVIIAGADMQLGENEVTIERTSATDGSNAGTLYYMGLLGLELFYDEYEEVTSIDQGIRVSRAYELVDGTPRDDGAYNIGDIVRVTVKVTVDSDKGYIYVQSPIPGGFEGINTRLDTVANTGDYGEPNWYGWGYNRMDFRDDSVDYFITRFSRGEREFSYLMRAITPGEFSVLPAEATPMYREDIWGRSGSELIAVEPEWLLDRPELLGDFDNDCRITRFDLQQVAGEWGTTTLPPAISGSDGVIDLTDVTLLGNREGASCVADYNAALDTANGKADFAIDVPSGEYGVGETFSVNIYLASTTGLDGFDVKLAFDAGALDVLNVKWGPKLMGALQLGPDVNVPAGYVSFGTYGLPSGINNGDLLATVTFINNSVGEAQIQAASVRAINAEGGMIAAQAVGKGDIKTQGEQVFMPLTFR